MLFHKKGILNLPRSIVVSDISIEFSPSVRYLGVHIDANWSFNAHFKYIEGKAGRVIRALNGLMPNLRGPDERRRRLYANVVYSVILYGAPIWGDTAVLNRWRSIIAPLERFLAQRVVSDIPI